MSELISPQVAIGITTKDREHDLRETLQKLLDLGLRDTPLYLIDDASEKSVSELTELADFTCVTIERNEECKGLIVNRNRLAEIVKEPILISLDDDSCFTFSPDFYELAEFFESHEDTFGVEFDNIDPPQTNGSDVEHSELVQMYTGFGHAVHVSRFLQLGGYRGFLFHMCEERELGQRAWKNKMNVRKYKRIQVQHRRTPTARLHDRNTYFLVRNTVYMNLANYGWIGLLWFIPASVYMVTGWPATKGRRWLAAKAISAAMRLLIEQRRLIDPMSFSAMRALRGIPQR